MVMYTKLMTAYDFEVKTDVQWPRIARQNTGGGFVNEPLQFPPTVVSPAKMNGQRTLLLENPTDVPIIIQPILLGDLEQKHKLEMALKDDYPFLGKLFFELFRELFFDHFFENFFSWGMPLLHIFRCPEKRPKIFGRFRHRYEPYQ